MVRVIAIALVAALAAGCAGHVNFGLAGMFIISTAEELRDPRPFPSFSAFYDWTGSKPVPPLAPERRVHEQDCSQPLEDSTANLKCR